MTNRVKIITGLVAVLAGRPLAAQVDSAPPQPQQTPTDRVAVPNLTEAIGGRFPGVTMLRPDGLSSTGGVIRIRGWRSLILSNEPAFEIDGVLVPGATASGFPTTMGSFLPGISMLDLIDPDEIERIEVGRGIAGGMASGAGLVNGLIRVTTRRGGPGMHWSVGSEWGVSSTPMDFDLDSYFVTRVGGGPSTASCTLPMQVPGGCQPDQVFRRNPARDPLLRQTSTGLHSRVRLGVHGTSGRLRYAVNGRWSRAVGPADLPPGDRAWLESVIGSSAERLFRPDRLGEAFGRAAFDADLGRGLSVAIAGNVARQTALTLIPPRGPSGGLLMNGYLADPRYPDSAAWLNDFARPAVAYRSAADRELLRKVAVFGVTWAPSPAFNSWVRVSGIWDRHDHIQSVEGPRQPGQLPIAPDADSLLYRDDQHQLEFGIRQRISVGPVRVVLSPVYQVRSREPSRYLAQTRPSMQGADAYRATGGALNAEVSAYDGRVGVGGLVRWDEVRRLDWWEEPTWATRVRAWWSGRLSGHVAFAQVRRRADVDGSPLLLGGGAGPLLGQLAPERTREAEIGARFRAPSGRLEIGAVGFSQRTTDGWGMLLSPPSGGILPYLDMVGAEIANRGLELDVTAWLHRGTGWDARIGGVATVLSTRLESNGEGVPPSIRSDLCSYPGSQPFARCGWSVPDVVDLNQDGLLTGDEYAAAGPSELGPRGGLLPSRTIGMWFDVARVRESARVSLIGHFDYQGGHWTDSYVGSTQCFLFRCRQMNDPASSIQEQAAGFTQPQAYFLRDASFGRMRELTLSWQTAGGLARRFGADRVGISLTARNLFAVSSYSFWDPEVRSYGHEFAPLDPTPWPLARAFTVKLSADW